MEPSSKPPPPSATDQSVPELQNLESKFGRLQVQAEEQQGKLIEFEQSKYIVQSRFIQYLLSSIKQRDKTLEETKKSLVSMQNANTDLEKALKETKESRFSMQNANTDLEQALKETKESLFSMQDANDDLEERIANLTLRSRYVVVLIDGDGYLFTDALLKMGSDGVYLAETFLRVNIQVFLQSRGIEFGDRVSLLIIYCTSRGNTIRALKRMRGHAEESLQSFYDEISHTFGEFNLIDVGPGEERADRRIQSLFKILVSQPGCLSAILGLCHDSGYLGMLEGAMTESDIQSKITLLTCTSTNPCYLKLPFEITKWDNIFRNTELQVGKTAPFPPELKHRTDGVSRHDVAYSSEVKSRETKLAAQLRLQPALPRMLITHHDLCRQMSDSSNSGSGDKSSNLPSPPTENDDLIASRDLAELAAGVLGLDPSSSSEPMYLNVEWGYRVCPVSYKKGERVRNVFNRACEEHNVLLRHRWKYHLEKDGFTIDQMKTVEEAGLTDGSKIAFEPLD